MSKNTSEKIELLRKWDKQILLPTENQFEILKEIGGLPWNGHLQFPAAIITNDGQQIDLCLFNFYKAEPWEWDLENYKKILLLSEIADIKPSEFALNHDIRLASTSAGEIMNQFYAFMVKTNTGKFLAYNGTTQFASTGETKGNEIVSAVEFSFDHFNANNRRLSGVSAGDITLVIGKWDERLQSLYAQYRPNRGND